MPPDTIMPSDPNMSSILVWADIPVTDMDRAMKFYGHVLQTELIQPFAGQRVAIPPREMGPVAFDLAMNDNLRPSSTEGAQIYLSAMGDIHAMAKRVEEAGGKIVSPPADMGDMVGFIAFFIDSEGNRIGIQQPPKATLDSMA
ncbi:MAG: VOC family protein [Actinobacteria bacterium]|nr:VOC family protein [Actinomycetota bacterium]